MESLLAVAHKEMRRRETLDVDVCKRKDQIRREYQRLIPEIYEFQVGK